VNTTSLNELVTAYVERYGKRFQWDRDMVLREHNLNPWVEERFDDLVRADPDAAWTGVLGVLAATDDDFTLSILAAGPLEDLIRLHGRPLIARIEDCARTDPKFRELLRGVWPNDMDPTVWQRVVQACEGPSDDAYDRDKEH
jgi:hypothetical protein